MAAFKEPAALLLQPPDRYPYRSHSNCLSREIGGGTKTIDRLGGLAVLTKKDITICSRTTSDKSAPEGSGDWGTCI